MSILGSLLGNDQYTLGELMSIDSGRQDRAANCKVELIQTYHELKKETVLDKFKALFVSRGALVNVYYIIFKFKVTSENGHPYTVLVRINPDFDLVNWKINKVKVYCACADFKYRSAYILDKHKSLFVNDRIKIALGEALTTTPKEKTKTTLLCKHSYAAVKWLVDNYTKLMKMI